MSKLKIVMFSIITITLLDACSGDRSRTDMLNNMNDDEKAHHRMELIIKALKNKNKDELKAMFSKQVLIEDKQMDINIEYLFKFFQGDVVSWERRGGLITDWNNDDGNKTTELKSFFYVDTNKQKYIVFLLEYTEDTFHPENVGLYTLRLIKKEDEKTQFGYWQDMKKAGIYRPVISK
jgi:hypothetical protein